MGKVYVMNPRTVIIEDHFHVTVKQKIASTSLSHDASSALT